MTVAERAVAEARLWLGTPYVHQASCRGAGTDCLGLLRGVWRALYGAEPEVVPAYTADWAEPTGDEVAAGGQAVAGEAGWGRGGGRRDPVPDAGGHVAKHLGLQSSVGAEARFIHAYSGHGVTESALTAPWRRRIAARFAFPDGAS